MGVSEHTIKNYLFRVFEKLGVSSRFELLFLLFNERHSEVKLICNLLVALSLGGVLGHLQFALRQQAELAVLDAVAARSVTESVKQVPSLIAPSPYFPAVDVLNAVVEFRDRIGSAEHTGRNRFRWGDSRWPYQRLRLD